MTPAEYFRRQLRAELWYVRDDEIRRIFVDAIDQGPGSTAWSEAIAILGLRQLGRDTPAPAGWESAVLRELKRNRRRARMRSIGLALAAVIVAAIAAASITWGWL